MRSLSLIASLAALFISAEAFAQPAQPAPAGQPATTDPQAQPAQPPVAGQQPPVAGGTGGSGQTIIVVQGGKNGTAGTPATPKGPVEDGARFRGGVGLDGGVFALPSLKLNLGAIGAYGHIGAQINDLVGVYAIPEFDILFGHLGGVSPGLGVVVDFTIADRFTVGVGPDVSYFAAIGLGSTSVAAAGGAGFGARIHLAAYPAVGRSDTAPRRKAFAIGLDTKILAEAGASESVGSNGVAAAAGYGVALHAMLTIGYEAM